MIINPNQFGKIDIPLAKVLARLGYAKGLTKADQETEELIAEEMILAGRLFVPRQVTAVSEIRFEGNNTIKLEPGMTIKSEDIHKLLSSSFKAYGLAVTIGPNLERKRDEYLAAKETARALVLDAVGSVAADELAVITNRQITEELAAEGFKTTKRFSPGYGDWLITEQKDFLNWLGADAIGIKLNENSQMTPEKSVSAIIGAYK